MADREINYIEFPAVDLDKTKAFYGNVLGWTFTDYGPEYSSFEGAGMDGGFTRYQTNIQWRSSSRIVFPAARRTTNQDF